MQNKLTPALWFHCDNGKVDNVITYYSEIFGGNFKSDQIIVLGETPSGYAEMCNVEIFGNKYLIMTTSIEHNKFNDSFAFIINCEDQEEIDKYWNYFTKEGSASRCGWCCDKFGLRWQIIPKNISELMSKPNANKVMHSQSKIIISEY